MGNKIYQVSKNIEASILEIEYVKKTDSYYWKSEKYRDALETNYHKCFDTKEEAIAYNKQLIELKISQAKSKLEYCNNKLNEFNQLYSS